MKKLMCWFVVIVFLFAGYVSIYLYLYPIEKYSELHPLALAIAVVSGIGWIVYGASRAFKVLKAFGDSDKMVQEAKD